MLYLKLLRKLSKVISRSCQNWLEAIQGHLKIMPKIASKVIQGRFSQI